MRVHSCVLASSALLHGLDLAMQESTLVVILDWPVVHWQSTSLVPHPEAAMAEVKQGSCTLVSLLVP